MKSKEVLQNGTEGSAVWQETLLGGALQFLSEIGEDISVSIPNRQLHDGDFIEIERQVRDNSLLFAARPIRDSCHPPAILGLAALVHLLPLHGLQGSRSLSQTLPSDKLCH